MTLDDALAELGLVRDTTWSDVKAAYRARIRAVHPDVALGSGRAAARLNDAFAVLERVYRRGEPAPPPPPGPPPPAPARRHAPFPPSDLAVIDDDTLTLVAPADEVFLRLANAMDAIGDLTYADAEAGYLEALVGGGVAQLVVSLQGRVNGTEAFFTLEPLGATPAPPIESVVRAVAAQLRRTD